jgi:hypothetical protein
VKRPIVLAIAAVIVAAVGVVASAFVLLPEDDAPGDEMPSGLAGTPIINPTPAFPVIPTPVPTPDPARNVPEVMLVDTATGKIRNLWETDHIVQQVEFSADGHWLYFVTYRKTSGPESATIQRLDLLNSGEPPEFIDRGFIMSLSSRGDLAYVAIR